MSPNNIHLLEMEARMYWAVASQFHRLAADTNATDEDVERALEELVVCKEHTTWPSVQARYDAILDGERLERETA